MDGCLEVGKRSPLHGASRKEEARKEVEDRGVQVTVVGCTSRETESSYLSRAWVLIGFRGQNRQ